MWMRYFANCLMNDKIKDGCSYRSMINVVKKQNCVVLRSDRDVLRG